MVTNETDQEALAKAAEDILQSCETIANKAAEELSRSRQPTQIANNPFTNPNADPNLVSAKKEVLSGYETLSREPSIARVTVEDEDGKKKTYYFRRKSGPLDSIPLMLVSLLAPMGRLASLPVGGEYDLDNDQSLTVLENVQFFPKKTENEWDAHRAAFRGKGYTKTIESLRTFLRQMGEKATDENVLETLLSEESSSANIMDGIRRSVIEKMDLRDQPILDQYQDEIFRLPLDSQLLILGAPGTGKTTTLIRRLGQKADLNFLDDDEKRLLDKTGAKADHHSNWIMFTPTELLKLYVKEAFSREGIPASDQRISTWSDFRENLARNAFPVLKSAANKGSLIMKDAAAILTPAAEADLIGLFDDFDQWQKAEFWTDLQADAKRLSENAASEVAGIGRKILSAIKGVDDKTTPSTFSKLAALTATIKGIVDTRKKETDKKFQESLNIQVNKNRAFLDELATFMERLSEIDDEADDQDADDEEEIDTPRIGRHAAMARYISASKSYARARAQGKQVSKTSSTGHIVAWLGDRIFAEDVAKEIGKSLIIQSALRRFVNPVRGYIDKISARYRRFRRIKQAEGRWYRGEGFAQTDVHPLEVDLILLAILRNTDGLIAGIRNPDEEAKKTLGRLQNLYYTQVLVDEATDFSPIQLACMAALSRPDIRSFFACGDFNQRFTSYGVQTIDQVKWAIPKIAEKRISIAYRHSNQLHRLAQAIIGLSGEGAADVHISAEYSDNEGFAPVLALSADKEDAQAAWLADRIKEIEKYVHKLPSIAVLVNDEEAVRLVSDSLKRPLENQNIQVIPCPDGRVRGRDSAVRVFNVQHIKGLEFEAVFFVGIDRLAENNPDLFEKYLYVGATRAATYFGITCEKGFPDQLSGIRSLFGDKWPN